MRVGEARHPGPRRSKNKKSKQGQDLIDEGKPAAVPRKAQGGTTGPAEHGNAGNNILKQKVGL